jgi:hypothetical protein
MTRPMQPQWMKRWKRRMSQSQYGRVGRQRGKDELGPLRKGNRNRPHGRKMRPRNRESRCASNRLKTHAKTSLNGRCAGFRDGIPQTWIFCAPPPPPTSVCVQLVRTLAMDTYRRKIAELPGKALPVADLRGFRQTSEGHSMPRTRGKVVAGLK